MEDKLEKEDWMLQPGVAAELMGLSEEEKDSIYRRYAAETDLQGQNIADANAVLQGPQSTGMTVGPGNLYVANAGGAIADGLRNFGAGRDRKAAKSELSNLATAEAGANKTTANVLGRVDQRNMGSALRGGNKTPAPSTSVLTPEELKRRRQAAAANNVMPA